MKNKFIFTISMLLLTYHLVEPGYAADQAESVKDALFGGEASIDVRYRYEFIDQINLDEAKASTLRTRLSYESQTYQNFSGKLEFDHNGNVFEDNDESATTAPILDDPYAEINQVYLSYAAPADTTVRYGRQRIELNNQRFIGGDAWYQNEQTFDALSAVNRNFKDTTILVAHLFNINTITGDNSGQGDYIFHLENNSIEVLEFSAYALALREVSDTYGMRADITLDLDEATAHYTAEFANQKSDGPGKYRTNYSNLEIRLDVAEAIIRLGFESLGSNNGLASFDTTLASKHTFNGWAGMFAEKTPIQGLEDLYASLSTTQFGPKIGVIFHRFGSDVDNIDFGTEVDFLIAHQFTDHYSLLLKAADFREGDPGYGEVNTKKVWLQLQARF